MGYREYLAHPSLRPFVDRFWTRVHRGEAGELRVLPDGCMDVLVDVDAGGVARCFAVGAMTVPLVIPGEALRRLHMVGVRFRPGGAGPFLRVPAHELTDRRVDTGGLGLGWLEGAVASCALGQLEPSEAVRALERVLVSRLPVVRAPDPLVAHVARQLSRPTPASVDALARRMGVSRQYLGRRFRAEVGIGPKQLARVARVQRAVAALQDAPGDVLAAAAVGTGYFDEAHMGREFRQLVGVTPGQARRLAGSIRPIISLFGEA